MSKETNKKNPGAQQRTDDALALSEKLLRSLTENAPVGIYLTDLNGDCRYANQKWREMAGMSLEDALGDGWVNALHPDDRERVNKQWYQLSATEWGWKQEYRFQTPGGKVTWIHGFATKVRDEQGLLIGYFGINVDSTSSKNLETSLYDSEERYRTTIDSMGDGIFVVDNDLKITLNNSTIARWVQEMGQSGILVGKTPAKAFPFLSEQAESEYRKIFQSGEILQTEEISRFGHRNVNTETRKIPFLANGDVTQIATVIRDITERKQAEKALEESEERYRNVFENTTIGMYQTTPDGRILLANPAMIHMLGYDTFEDLSRRNLEDSGFEPDYQRSEFRQRIESDGLVHGIEAVWKKKDGATIFVRESAKAIRDEAGKVLRYEGTVENITERKLAEKELEKSENRYRNILTSISDAVYITDERGGFTFICPNVDVIFGYTSEDVQKFGNINKLLGTQITDYEEVSKAGELNNLEHEIVDKSGQKHALLINVKKVEIEDGKMLFSCRDITERKRAEVEIRRQAEQLKTLRDTTLEVVAPHELSLLLPIIVERAADMVGASEGGLYLSDPDKQEVQCVVSYNTKRDYTGTVLKFGEGAAGTVAQTREALIIDDYRTWPKRASVFEEDQPFLSILSVPLLWLGQVSGVLHVLNEVEGKSFSQADQELLTMFAAQAAIAVGKAEMLEQAQQEVEERKRTEESLKESEFKLKNAEKVAHFGHYEIDIQTGKTKWSDETYRIFEMDPNTDTVPTQQEYTNYLHPDDIDMLYAHFDETINNKKDFDLDYRIITRNKKIKYVHSLGKLTSDANGNPITMFGVFHDITERKLTEDILDTRLRISEMAAYHSQDKLLQITLDEVERLTGSSIGFFHFVEDDQINLHLQMWSTNTLESMCSIEGQGQHYPVDQAGVWAECLHKKQPVIHNDYESLPNKKGYPEGHSKVVRELTVPIIVGNKVKAIIGVGNKETDYVESDVNAVSTLANMVWDIIVRKRAELALIEGEKNLQAVLDASFDSVLLIETDGQIVACNQTISTRFGVDKYSVIGTNIYDLLDEAVAEKRRGYVEQVIASGEAVRFEDERLGRIIDNSIYPIFDNGGQVVRLALYGQDITDRVKAEKETREAKDLLKTTFASLDQAVFVVDKKNRTVLSCNHAAENIFGYRKDEIVGQTTQFLYVDHSMFEEYVQMIEPVLNDAGTAQSDMQLKRKDGSIFYAHVTDTSILDDDGQHTGIVKVIRKAAEQKEPSSGASELRQQAEKILSGNNLESASLPAMDADIHKLAQELEVYQIELELQNEELIQSRAEIEALLRQYSDLYDFSPVGYFTLAQDGTILKANLTGANLLGLTRKELLERRFGVFVAPSFIPTFNTLLENTLGSSKNESCEIPLLKGGGESIWVYIEASPGATDEQPVIYAVVSNITERKQIEEALQQNQKFIQRVADTIPNQLYVFDLTEGQNIYINRKVEDFFGLDLEELQSKEPKFFLDIIHPDDLDKLDEFNVQWDTAEDGQIFLKEYRMKNAKGEYRWIQSYERILNRGSNGKPTQIVGTAIDVTERVQAEEKVRESRARFQAVLENSFDAAYRRNLLTDAYDYISPTIERISGYTAEEYSEISIAKILYYIHPDDVQQAVDIIEKSMTADENPYYIEYRFRHKDGSYRWFGDLFSVVKGKKGIPIARYGSVRDITEHKCINQALQENEHNLQMLFDTMSEGIALNEIIYDENGEMVDYCILKVNRVFYTTADYSGKDVEGNLATQLYGMSSDFIKDFWKEHLKNNVIVHTEMLSPLNNKSFYVSTSPFVNDRFVTSFFDITERKQIEAKLQKSEERYRRLAENAPDIIFRYALSPSPELEYINPATEKITGYTPEDCYADPLLMLNIAHPEDAHLMADLMQARGPFNKQITMRWIGKDSIVRWMESRLVPVYDEANQLVAVEGLTRDITERKLAEQENERLLMEITKQREELRALNARLIATDETERRRIARELHDQIGQNLSALSINMNILLSQASADDEKLRKRLNTSLQLVDETADSIRNVMENLHPTVLDDYGLLPALEWLSERISQRTDLQVSVSSRSLKEARLQPKIEASLFRITQEALTNVLRHAQATRAKIELKQLKNVLRLSITDDGAGFDLSGHPKPGNRKQGWGLRIMRERAESIGGSFRVESAAGKGYKVIIELSNDNNYFVG